MGSLLGGDRLSDKIKEYEELVTDEVVLPSGPTWVISTPDTIALARYYDAMGLSMADKELAEKLKGVSIPDRIAASITHLVPSAVVDPPISAEKEEGKLWIGRIRPDDMNTIIEKMWQLIGLTEEDVEDASFLG